MFNLPNFKKQKKFTFEIKSRIKLDQVRFWSFDFRIGSIERLLATASETPVMGSWLDSRSRVQLEDEMSFFSSSKECVEREREGSERMFPFGGEKKRGDCLPILAWRKSLSRETSRMAVQGAPSSCSSRISLRATRLSVSRDLPL